MARYEFRSVCADEIKNYINDKTEAGFDGDNFRRNLIGFDRFCVEQRIMEPVFSTFHASRWLEQRKNESHTTHYLRINSSKQFLKYLSIKGYDVFVVRDIKYKGTDFEPHIYTDAESERYFMAVDSYTSGMNRKDAIQYPVLFRILYCCGTRINETLGIRKKDVDLDKGILLLNETKNDKQRYVVVGDDLKAKHRDFLFRAGIPYIGDGNGPRIHDWRHHMAVYSFKQMTDSGLDMYVALPILSTYLGHKTIFATEKYVRLTLQLFPYIEEKFHSTVDRIFGKITKEGADDENN